MREGTVKAVDDISFGVTQRKMLRVVGESGCGKSTTARLLLRAHDPTGGQVRFRMPDERWVDIFALEKSEIKGLWCKM